MSNKVGRKAIWREIFAKPTWKWLVTVPFAVLGALQIIRDDFLKAGTEEYKFINYFPNISWQSYAVIIFILILGILLESAYRTVKQRELKINSIIDEFAYALQLISVNTEVERYPDVTQLRYKLALKNSINKPIKYEVMSLYIDDIKLQDPLSTGGVIPALADAGYYTHYVGIDYKENQKLISTIIFEILYGPPAMFPTRKIYRKIYVETNYKINTTFIDIENTDEPYGLD